MEEFIKNLCLWESVMRLPLKGYVIEHNKHYSKIGQTLYFDICELFCSVAGAWDKDAALPTVWGLWQGS